MSKIIAVVRLSPGEVAFYDPFTRIHLTIASPETKVFSGQNLTNVKRAVKSGRLKLLSGSLTPVVNNTDTVKTKDEAIKVESSEPVKVEEKNETPKKEEIKETIEEVKETEEIIDIKPKRGRKKKEVTEESEPTEAVETNE